MVVVWSGFFAVTHPDRGLPGGSHYTPDFRAEILDTMATPSSPHHPDGPEKKAGRKEKFKQNILKWDESTASNYSIITQDKYTCLSRR